MVAAFSFGTIIAIPIIPFIDDRFGRKTSVILGSIIVLIGVIIQTASVDREWLIETLLTGASLDDRLTYDGIVAMFLVSRFVLGSGIAFATNGASQLIAELAYPKERAVITGLFNDSWYVGGIIAAGITLGTFSMESNWAWRLPSLFQMIPSVLQLLFIWFVPESPRWLLSRDRSEEAFDILVKYHAEGDRDDPFALAEFAQIRETIRLEAESSKNSWFEMVNNRANRWRTFLTCCVGIFAQWSGNGLTGYYLVPILKSIGITSNLRQQQLNLSKEVVDLVASVIGAFLANVMRRRTQFLTSFIGLTFTFAALTGCSAAFALNYSNSGAIGAVTFLFIYPIFYNFQHPLTYVYVTEIFPFIYRAKGVAISQLMSSVASAFNQYVNPIALDAMAWRLYIVYVAWLIVEVLVVYFLYPETKGPTLEELAIIFEGNDAHVGVVHVDKAKGGAEVDQVETV